VFLDNGIEVLLSPSEGDYMGSIGNYLLGEGSSNAACGAYNQDGLVWEGHTESACLVGL
jgi:hypothetical protein